MSYPPHVLKSLVSPPPAYPGSAPNPVNPMAAGGAAHGHGAPGAHGGGDAPKSEPASLHDASLDVQAKIKAARAALEDLVAQAQMGESIDPSVEKTISAAADSLGEIDDSVNEIVESLGGSRQDHEDMVTGGSDDVGGKGGGGGFGGKSG